MEWLRNAEGMNCVVLGWTVIDLQQFQTSGEDYNVVPWNVQTGHPGQTGHGISCNQDDGYFEAGFRNADGGMVFECVHYSEVA